jgi:hypothetical protein
MPIEFHCSRCERLLRTGDDTVGRMAQCPQCGAQTQVPNPEISGSASFSQSGGGESFVASSQQAGDSTGGYRNPYQVAAMQGPGVQSNVMYASQRISTPATCLIVTAALGLVIQTMNILSVVLKIGTLAVFRPNHFLPMLLQGPVPIVSSSIAIIVGIVMLIGAIKMKGLENYGFAMTVSILAMIPCLSPCCFLGLPFGIWALVVLCDPVVKASFRS